jgi:hypothetical protein
MIAVTQGLGLFTLWMIETQGEVFVSSFLTLKPTSFFYVVGFTERDGD